MCTHRQYITKQIENQQSLSRLNLNNEQLELFPSTKWDLAQICEHGSTFRYQLVKPITPTS